MTASPAPPAAEIWKTVMPSRAIGLLMAIGFLDLIATAVLHANGLIVELNPVMRPLIERSEWLFAVVKGATLLAAWGAMAYYARVNREFVKRAALAGAAVYGVVWIVWFVAGSLSLAAR